MRGRPPSTPPGPPSSPPPSVPLPSIPSFSNSVSGDSISSTSSAPPRPSTHPIQRFSTTSTASSYPSSVFAGSFPTSPIDSGGLPEEAAGSYFGDADQRETHLGEWPSDDDGEENNAVTGLPFLFERRQKVSVHDEESRSLAEGNVASDSASSTRLGAFRLSDNTASGPDLVSLHVSLDLSDLSYFIFHSNL